MHGRLYQSIQLSKWFWNYLYTKLKLIHQELAHLSLFIERAKLGFGLFSLFYPARQLIFEPRHLVPSFGSISRTITQRVAHLLQWCYSSSHIYTFMHKNNSFMPSSQWIWSSILSVLLYLNLVLQKSKLYFPSYHKLTNYHHVKTKYSILISFHIIFIYQKHA